MKIAVVLALLCMVAFVSARAEETYQNPLTIDGQHPPIASGAPDYGIGDPFVMRWNGLYYLYPSTCEDKVRVFTSPDLVHWTYRGFCTLGQDVKFAYAPEVAYWRGDFYMVTSPYGNGHYILKSDSPLGPFTPITGNFGHVIDGSLYVRDDGTPLLIYPQDWFIRACALDEETLLPDPIKFNLGATLRHWTEGPGLFRRGEYYYLTFTGNHLISSGYRVAYASRLGGEPTDRLTQPEDCTILINSKPGDPFTGLGHSSNVIGPDLDSLYTAYHSFVNITGPARLYNVDRLLTNGGALYAAGPTDFAMPVPAMPDIYGDLSGNSGGFARADDGFAARATPSDRFTQECNFTLNGGVAAWQMGKGALAEVSQSALTVAISGERHIAQLPPLGRESALHTLRVEHTPEITYFYIDGMRVMTLENARVTADEIKALDREHVVYSFCAHTGKALGSGDGAAVKAIPGVFHAVHRADGAALATRNVGVQGAEALTVSGEARYAVSVAADGQYAFEVCLTPDSAGKTLTFLMDGQIVLSTVVPEYTGAKKMDTFTFATPPMTLPAGFHTLTLASDGACVYSLRGYPWQAVESAVYHFDDRAQRKTFYTLGDFRSLPTEGTARIAAGKSGFALFGGEGCANYSLRVRCSFPEGGSGAAGVVVNVRDPSVFKDQVAEGFFGYAVNVTRMGVTVLREFYGASGATEFASVKAWKDAEYAEFTVRAEGNRIRVFLPGEETPVLTFQDANGFVRGQYGFYGTGKGFEIYELTVEALP